MDKNNRKPNIGKNRKLEDIKAFKVTKTTTQREDTRIFLTSHKILQDVIVYNI